MTLRDEYGEIEAHMGDEFTASFDGGDPATFYIVGTCIEPGTEAKPIVCVRLYKGGFTFDGKRFERIPEDESTRNLLFNFTGELVASRLRAARAAADKLPDFLKPAAQRNPGAKRSRTDRSATDHQQSNQQYTENLFG
jgi:hypothetical protein